MVTSIATPARIPASTVATPRIATAVAGETVEAVAVAEEEAGTTAAEVATSIGMAIAPGIASARD